MLCKYLGIIELEYRDTPQKSVENYIPTRSETTNTATKHEIKRSSIAKNLIYSSNWGKNYDKTKFKMLRKCTNLFDLIKL